MTVPTAHEMASALHSALQKLYDNGILQHESQPVISGVCASLRGFKRQKSWSYSVGRGAPILFVGAVDKNGDAIVPSISVECISVDATRRPFPYLDWNIALEVRYVEDGRPCARWHFDLANEGQSGPVVHLQYGGHFADERELDHNLKVPRWHTPLMDLTLLAETVSANFFPERWEQVRDDPVWCESVHLSQQLCFVPYLDRVQEALNFRSRTVLSEVWNDRWR